MVILVIGFIIQCAFVSAHECRHRIKSDTISDDYIKTSMRASKTPASKAKPSKARVSKTRLLNVAAYQKTTEKKTKKELLLFFIVIIFIARESSLKLNSFRMKLIFEIFFS